MRANSRIFLAWPAALMSLLGVKWSGTRAILAGSLMLLLLKFPRWYVVNGAGLVLGVGIVEGVNYLLVTTGADGSMFTNPEVNFSVAMKALEVLVVAGILAGLVPAYRAVSMKPIDALRNE